MSVSGAATRLSDDLRALDRAYSQGHHGRWSASRRSALIDAHLRAVFEEADPPGGVALIATGGYGRGELAPASDVDLLVLHVGAAADSVALLVDRLLYPLWDSGLAIGHAVRTPEEAAAIAAERLDVVTATLDGRLLAGDRDVWESARSGVLRVVAGDRTRAFAERLRDDAERRAARHGAVSWLLEPELKEGRGGLRDAHSLRWLSIAATGRPDGLVGVGLLRAAESAAVDDASEFLLRVRSALHLETERPGDRLVMDVQPTIARALGFDNEPDLPAVDALMRNIFEHARQIEHVVESAFDRFLRGRSDAVEVDPTPSGALRALVATARRGGVPSPGTLDAIDRVHVPDIVDWTSEVRGAFLGLLHAGAGGVRALETLDRLGLLERFVPSWAAVRCRPQRDPYHRYSVDVHLLRTLASMYELLYEGTRDDPIAAEAVAAAPDRSGLLLGALLHDIGKTGRGSHLAIGAAIAGEEVDRMGLEPATADLVRFLVGEHLLLSDTATRRDIDDDDLILDVAARVATPDRLAALYLLTRADAAATGPQAWTPWRATLVRELVGKVERALERGAMGAELAERMAARTDELRARIDDDAAVDAFVLRMPRTYLLNVPVGRIARHVDLLRGSPIDRSDVRTLAEVGDRPGTYSLTVVARDRPGLLSWIAGALSLSGLSILTAQVFTTRDDLAVDVFEVEGAFEPEVTEERWREIRSTLRRVLAGRLALEQCVRQKRAHYPAASSDVEVHVTSHNDVSDVFTVVEVGGPDRIGLLFDITAALAELRLDVHLAKVATYGGRVVDAFYVRDELGRKIEDPAQLHELERTLTARVRDEPS